MMSSPSQWPQKAKVTHARMRETPDYLELIKVKRSNTIWTSQYAIVPPAVTFSNKVLGFILFLFLFSSILISLNKCTHIHEIKYFHYLPNDIDQKWGFTVSESSWLNQGHPFKCVSDANLATKISVNICLNICLSV